MKNIINLFELKIKGVTIVVKAPPEIEDDRIGEYSSIFRKITIRKEITPFWFATLTTMLHEYGHHRQRFLMYVLIILSIVLSIGTFIVSLFILINDKYLLYVLTLGPFFVIVTLLQIFHFEQDADNYMIQKIPDVIILLLSQLEIIEVAESLGNRHLKRSLAKLHKEMKLFSPDLLESR